nr:recombinase family protein [Mycobacterium marinum]
MYADGAGLRYIAQQLTDDGVPPPSQYGQARNRHRDPRGWSHSAIRAILDNPAYRGIRVWGKQEKYEVLVNPDDVAAGYETRMRWRDQNRLDRTRPPHTRSADPGRIGSGCSSSDTGAARSWPAAENRRCLMRCVGCCSARRVDGGCRAPPLSGSERPASSTAVN